MTEEILPPVPYRAGRLPAKTGRHKIIIDADTIDAEVIDDEPRDGSNARDITPPEKSTRRGTRGGRDQNKEKTKSNEHSDVEEKKTEAKTASVPPELFRRQSGSPAFAWMLLAVAVAVALLVFTGGTADPKFDGDRIVNGVDVTTGKAAQWADLRTGKIYNPDEVPVCGDPAGSGPTTTIANVGGGTVDIRTCSVFGAGAGLLYATQPGVWEKTEIVKANPRLDQIQPGHPLLLTAEEWGYRRGIYPRARNTCFDAYAVDVNGNIAPSGTNLEFRIKQNGVWGNWQKRPLLQSNDPSIIFHVQAVELRTPDGIPRVIRRHAEDSVHSLRTLEARANGQPDRMNPGQLRFCLD